MKLLRALAALALAAAAVTATAQTNRVRGYNVMPSPGSKAAVTFQIDSIDFRDDLARVYGHIYGRPHTSTRIDGFFIKPDAHAVAPGTSLEEAEATDIDGFEFTHRFQFEDDGDIPIEIDFPPLVEADTYYMRVANPEGFYGLTIRKAVRATRINKARRRR